MGWVYLFCSPSCLDFLFLSEFLISHPSCLISTRCHVNPLPLVLHINGIFRGLGDYQKCLHYSIAQQTILKAYVKYSLSLAFSVIRNLLFTDSSHHPNLSSDSIGFISFWIPKGNCTRTIYKHFLPQKILQIVFQLININFYPHQQSTVIKFSSFPHQWYIIFVFYVFTHVIQKIYCPTIFTCISLIMKSLSIIL